MIEFFKNLFNKKPSTIKEITGDLVKQAKDYDIIVHGCNCFCTMGSGIAPQIKKKWPEAYEVDKASVRGDRRKLGTITFTKNTKPIVINAYTQFNYGGPGRNLDYKAVRSCMKQIRFLFSRKKIAMPMIGAGLAGGNWSKIFGIIKQELEGEDVTIIKWDQG